MSTNMFFARSVGSPFFVNYDTLEVDLQPLFKAFIERDHGGKFVVLDCRESLGQFVCVDHPIGQLAVDAFHGKRITTAAATAAVAGIEIYFKQWSTFASEVGEFASIAPTIGEAIATAYKKKPDGRERTALALLGRIGAINWLVEAQA